jgi:hypothetical protein
VKVQSDMDNVEAVQAADDQVMDMLRLCRSEYLGVRDLAPAGSEIKDFTNKWHATTGDHRVSLLLLPDVAEPSRFHVN